MGRHQIESVEYTGDARLLRRAIDIAGKTRRELRHSWESGRLGKKHGYSHGSGKVFPRGLTLEVRWTGMEAGGEARVWVWLNEWYAVCGTLATVNGSWAGSVGVERRPK